ncbi:hypothetical protein IEQ34_001969 [Dendrobium chrysotoxum]|uniref:Uncharacterized protein n=1 Tax=Dendrobium chrysotoxum TaxID=161865 RepID=A0AAV7HM34_DENCH|nr:hypothetical protein IEQ34_001969 [Dendrobium chrysotoxum]
MANLPLLFLITFSSLLLPITSKTPISIHHLLLQHGLPAGLLPKAVESYKLDQTTGLLEVYLDRPCYAKYDGLAFFDQVIRANLSYGALRGVVGLKQEELFLWLPVRGILVDYPFSGVILFDIGVARKQLSLSLFEVPPECRPASSKLPAGRIREVFNGKKVEKLVTFYGFLLGLSIPFVPFFFAFIAC